MPKSILQSKIITITLFVLWACNYKLAAQPLTAYTTYQNKFVVWDDNVIREIEFLIPTSYAIGRSAIAYVDNSLNFKIYQNGGVHQINSGFTNQYTISDNLVTYLNANSLFVWDNGKSTLLSSYISNYSMGDSVVLFFDNVRNQYNAYYNGNITTLESFLAANSFDITDTSTIGTSANVAAGQIPNAKCSDNIIAYINYSGLFHIFYQGNNITQEQYAVQSFGVGRNTVAYVDANQQFKIFHDGKTQVIEDIKPNKYSVGDNIVAYVSSDNIFKVFYNDSVYSIGYFEPNYTVSDYVVSFTDANGYFSVFYKGQIYPLEPQTPTTVKQGYNTVAYINSGNQLKAFSEGHIYNVTTSGISDWRLDYDVIQYSFGNSLYRVFYRGNTF